MTGNHSKVIYTPPGSRSRKHALGVPRLETEDALIDKRPNIPLNELTGGHVERLLSLTDRWIEDVRAYAGEPETGDETQWDTED